MKRNVWLPLVLAALVLAGCGEQGPEYITVGEETYPADVQQLDLREQAVSVGEYEQLRAELPECEILWKVPFQGQQLELDTRKVALESLNEGDLEALGYLTALEEIDLGDCPDRELMETLEAAFPGCTLSYTVTIGGQKLEKDAAALTLAAEELGEALEKLDYLPELREITVSDVVSDTDALLALKEACPELAIHGVFLLFDRELSTDAAEVDLSGIEMESVEAVEAVLPLFNQLEKLTLCDTGLPSEELDAMWKRHPETRVIWNVKVGYSWLRTDVTTFMPFKLGYDGLEGVEMKDKHMTEMKYLVDVVCMDLGHQGMTNIEFVRYMPNLKYLIIADSTVTDLSPLAELKNLEYLEAFMNGITDISALAGCTGLRDVNLCYNDITDITPLLELPNLENIWISSNFNLAQEQKDLLSDRFPEAKIVFMTQSSTGLGWRNLPRYYEQRDLLGMGYMVG